MDRHKSPWSMPNWASHYVIAPCRRPPMPPVCCRTCLRGAAGEGEGVEPALTRKGRCFSAIDRNDPSMGIPF